MNCEKTIVSKERIHEYLMSLRDDGIINMFGATPYLELKFDMTRSEAKEALLIWMQDMTAGRVPHENI